MVTEIWHRMQAPATNTVYRLSYAAALSTGIVEVLAFSPFDRSLLALPCWLVLALLWQYLPPKRALLCGFYYGLGKFGFGISWVYVSMHDVGGLGWPIAGMITLALVLLLSLFPSLLGYLLAQWTPQARWQRPMIGLPTLWILTEWMRSWLFSGFGWLNSGYTQLDLPLEGWAPIVGVLGVGALLVASSGAMAASLTSLWQRNRLSAILAPLLLPAFLWLTGEGLRHISWSHPDGEPLRVALIQGNVEQHLKWDEQQFLQTLVDYRNLTAQHWDKDLIIWPEAAIPALYANVERHYIRPLMEQAKASQTALIIGVMDQPQPDGPVYNAMLLLNGEQTFYYKHHLTPFGEAFPVPPLIRQYLRMMNLPYSDLGQGSWQQHALMLDQFRIAPTICYEILFGAQVLRHFPESNLLVNISNDAWFGDSLAPWQHFQIARMRSLETARPMIRATNTGTTALIDSHGRVAKQLPPFQQSVLSGAVEPRAGSTPYMYWGDKFAVGFAIAGLLWMLYQTFVVSRAKSLL